MCGNRVKKDIKVNGMVETHVIVNIEHMQKQIYFFTLFLHASKRKNKTPKTTYCLIKNGKKKGKKAASWNVFVLE